MDVGLPGKNGCEATEEIRRWEKSSDQHTPIIALTAHVDEDNKSHCIQSGMDYVLTKPLSDEAALKAIAMVSKDLLKISEIPEAKVEESELSNKSIINMGLGEKLAGSKANALNMLAMLVDLLPKMEDNLRKFYGAEDWESLRFETHKLNGGVCYCGVPRLREAVERFGCALRSGNAQDITQGYENLIAEISSVLEEYKKVS